MASALLIKLAQEMFKMFVDLHTHSTSSDGTYTPAKLVEAAELLAKEAANTRFN